MLPEQPWPNMKYMYARRTSIRICIHIHVYTYTYTPAYIKCGFECSPAVAPESTTSRDHQTQRPGLAVRGTFMAKLIAAMLSLHLALALALTTVGVSATIRMLLTTCQVMMDALRDEIASFRTSFKVWTFNTHPSSFAHRNLLRIQDKTVRPHDFALLHSL
jgi:hypothetical protein